jgi:hypothetical protein
MTRTRRQDVRYPEAQETRVERAESAVAGRRASECPEGGERAFQAQIVRLAHLCGWWVHANPDSRRVAAGLPDLILVHPARGRLLFREVKTRRGRLRPEQAALLDALRACGVSAAVWRPADWQTIVEELAS